MIFYGLKSCDSCRKAKTDLKAAGITPTVLDLRDDGLDRATVQAILDEVGPAGLNKASTTWRALSEADRAGDPVDLIVANPTLLKRPAIQSGGVWTVGWTPAVKAARLGKG